MVALICRVVLQSSKVTIICRGDTKKSYATHRTLFGGVNTEAWWLHPVGWCYTAVRLHTTFCGVGTQQSYATHKTLFRRVNTVTWLQTSVVRCYTAIRLQTILCGLVRSRVILHTEHWLVVHVCIQFSRVVLHSSKVTHNFLEELYYTQSIDWRCMAAFNFLGWCYTAVRLHTIF